MIIAPENESPDAKAAPSSEPAVNNAPLPTQVTGPRPAKRWDMVTTLAALIACLALILAAKSSYQLQNFIKTQVENKGELDLRIQQWDGKLQQLVLQQQNTRQEQAEFQQKFQGLKQQVEDNLSANPYQRQQDWLKLKARNYLEIAQINSNWADSPDMTIELLTKADTLLKEMKSQEAFAIRQNIAKEVVELRAMPLPDYGGLLSQLDALQTSLTALPILTSNASGNSAQKDGPVDNAATKTTNNQSKAVTNWESHWQNSLFELKKLIIVKHYAGNFEPALYPLQQAIARERIRMDLQKAEWAVLHNNNSVYQQSLDQALDKAQKTLESQAASTKAFITGITTLKQSQLVKPTLPNLQSLELLNAWIAKKDALSQGPLEQEAGPKAGE